QAIAASGNTTCALTASGGVKCWGANDSGQLGDGTFQDRAAPTDVIGLTSGVVAISVGRFNACAGMAGGTVKCWGANGGGELGTDPSAPRTVPVDVPGIAGATAVMAGPNDLNCAIVAGAGVKCWGQLATIIKPTTIDGMSDAASISAFCVT